MILLLLFMIKQIFSSKTFCAEVIFAQLIIVHHILCYLKKWTIPLKKHQGNTRLILDCNSTLILSPGLRKFSDKQWWTQLSVCVRSITGSGVLKEFVVGTKNPPWLLVGMNGVEHVCSTVDPYHTVPVTWSGSYPCKVHWVAKFFGGNFYPDSQCSVTFWYGLGCGSVLKSSLTFRMIFSYLKCFIEWNLKASKL
jgi:hypothetical protein